MTDTEPTLFDEPTLFEPSAQPPTISDRPLCPRCRVQPVAWGTRNHQWRPYCGTGGCVSLEIRCIMCHQVKPKAEFRYVKYCTDECRKMAHDETLVTRYDQHKCVRCGRVAHSRSKTPKGWRDGRCATCWGTRIGYDRMGSFALHNVPWDLADHLAEHNWPCSVCGEYVPHKTGAIDHDHDCCPGGRSCGKCIRGYLHGNCNIALGFLNNDPALLRAAADYLERWDRR